MDRRGFLKGLASLPVTASLPINLLPPLMQKGTAEQVVLIQPEGITYVHLTSAGSGYLSEPMVKLI